MGENTPMKIADWSYLIDHYAGSTGCCHVEKHICPVFRPM